MLYTFHILICIHYSNQQNRTNKMFLRYPYKQIRTNKMLLHYSNQQNRTNKFFQTNLPTITPKINMNTNKKKNITPVLSLF